MLLVPVPAFSKIPDGRLRIGPLQGPISRIRTSFMRYGLRLSIETADPVMVSRHMHGLILSCAGPGVRGYLLDRDRIEAPSSDVDVLMGILLPEGAVCRVTGHSLSEETMMVESEALFWRVDGQVLSSERRELIGTDGTRRLLSARSAGSHRLRDARTSGRLMAV
jgi:hypothetical protein